jgi:hypothetical protein
VSQNLPFIYYSCRSQDLAPAQRARLDEEDITRVLLAPQPRTRFNRTRPLFWEWRGQIQGACWNQSPQLALRADIWKLLINPDGTRPELYDMWGLREAGGAPPETANVRTAQPEVVARLREVLLGWKSSLDAENVTWTVRKPGCASYPWP